MRSRLDKCREIAFTSRTITLKPMARTQIRMNSPYHVSAQDKEQVRHRFPVSAGGAGGLCFHVPGHHSCK